MPIGSDFTLDYTAKRITHTSGTTVYQMYELYAWLMDQLDDSSTIDDPVPMTAQTPTSYTLTNGWFIDEVSLQYLYGGSLQTSGWNGVTNATGIRVLTFDSGGYTSAIASDIGKTVVNGGDTGTLLYYDNSLRKWWVRQNATTDDFPSGSVTITSGTGAGTLTAASVTGENIWVNIFTLGTLVDNTQVYVVRNDVRLTAWWGMGHIDVLVLVQEAGVLIDDGYLTIFARQYSTLFDHYRADFSDGGRVPVPLAAFTDNNNQTGHRQMVTSTASGTFVDGELIQDDSDGTILGVVTAVSGSVPNVTLQYYLTGPTLADFGAGTGGFTGQTSGATATAVAPTNVGPAAFSGITFTFGATNQNLNNGEGLRPYDVVVDCNSYALSDVYEYIKYVTRQGSTVSLNGYDGEQYTAVGEVRLPYDGQSTAFSEGETINGQTSGATAVVVADHDAGATGALILKEVVGTFSDNENIRSGVTVRAVANIPSGVEEIAATKQSPFGTFAGGTFFGARGVWLTNYLSADANSFQLIDSEGETQIPPQTVALTISNTASGDRVAVFKTTGSNEIIDKNQFTIDADQSSGVGYIRVDGSAPVDTPTTGVIRVVRRNGSGLILGEERYSFTAWTDNTTYTEFTLSGTTSHDYAVATDTAYVPYVDEQATGTSVSKSLVYVSDRNVLITDRISGMLPFKITGQITSSGMSVTVIRTADAIYQ